MLACLPCLSTRGRGAWGVAGARAAGVRAVADLRGEKITYKIREHSVQKLPYQVVVGDKEKAAGLVAVRVRGGQDLGQMPLESLIERLKSECDARVISSVSAGATA